MITIYHNPRCRKSREGLAIVEASGKPYEVIKYLEQPLKEDALQNIINMLGISPIELVRTQEAIWKEQFKGKTLTNQEIVQAMVAHPKLIERPIVVHKSQAIIGRPPEEITKIL